MGLEQQLSVRSKLHIQTQIITLRYDPPRLRSYDSCRIDRLCVSFPHTIRISTQEIFKKIAETALFVCSNEAVDFTKEEKK
jgi:hypothetical protein